MKNVESTFTATAGTLLTAYTPEIGSAPIVRSGTGNAVITSAGRVRGGTTGTDSFYEYVEDYRGVLMDATFNLVCVSDNPQDVRVHLLYKSTDGDGFYAGMRWQSSAEWLFNTNGGSQFKAANPVAGKSYIFRLRVNPYYSVLYIDGVEIFRGVGSDSIGDQDNRSAAIFLSNSSGLTDVAGWHVDNLRIWSGNPRPTSTTIPSALAPTYQQQVMCLSILVKITRTDGTILGFTTHDKTITFMGLRYEAMSAVTASNIRYQVGKDPDNLDISGILNSDSITELDLRNGFYDDAKITVMECNWSNIAAGVRVGLAGVIGDLTITDGQYKATILSNLQLLQRQIGRATTPSCTVHQFGDFQCKFDVNGNTVQGDPITSSASVTSVTAQEDLILAGIVTKSGFYTYGLLTSTSGSNSGLRRQIKLHGDSVTADARSANASPISTGNLSYKHSNDYTPSQTITVPIPAGVWDSAILTVTTTWSNIGLINDPDILYVQIPPGQANESQIRSTNGASDYSDTFTFGIAELTSLNAAAGGNLSIAYRHSSNIPSGAPFMNVKVNSLTLSLIGSAAATSSRIVLQEEFPYTIAPGDTFSIQKGCDRLHTTCIRDYANIDNFRGFPYLPGNNLLQKQGRGANAN